MSTSTINLRSMPAEFAELLDLDPERVTAQFLPSSLTRADIVDAGRSARELQQLAGAPFIVRFEPGAMLCSDHDEDTGALGHLFSVTLDWHQAEAVINGTLDDRDADLPGQLHAWLLRAAAVFRGAADRIAATRKSGK